MRSSTFQKWLRPYLFIVVCSIGLGVMMYSQALHTVEQNVEQIQKNALF